MTDFVQSGQTHIGEITVRSQLKRFELGSLFLGLTVVLTACSDNSSESAGIAEAVDPLAAARRVHDSVLVIDAHADIHVWSPGLGERFGSADL